MVERWMTMRRQLAGSLLFEYHDPAIGRQQRQSHRSK
jgi:hypothetical protein